MNHDELAKLAYGRYYRVAKKTNDYDGAKDEFDNEITDFMEQNGIEEEYGWQDDMSEDDFKKFILCLINLDVMQNKQDDIVASLLSQIQNIVFDHESNFEETAPDFFKKVHE